MIHGRQFCLQVKEVRRFWIMGMFLWDGEVIRMYRNSGEDGVRDEICGLDILWLGICTGSRFRWDGVGREFGYENVCPGASSRGNVDDGSNFEYYYGVLWAGILSLISEKRIEYKKLN